jgi:hypothetical protein
LTHPFSPFLAAELGLGWLLWGADAFAGLARIAGRPSLRVWRAAITPALFANLALLVALWAGRLAAGAFPR